MAKLTGQSIASSYDQVVIVDDSNGITSSLQALESADTGGGVSALKIATNKVEVIPSAADDANAFEVSKADGTAIITADSSAETVDIAGHDASAKGLKLGGTLVSATAAELNVLDAGTANGSEQVSGSSSVIMTNNGVTEKRDIDTIAEYFRQHFSRNTAISLWNTAPPYEMSNTTGQDLSNCDAPFNAGDYNESSFEMKCLVFITNNTAPTVNFQLYYERNTGSGITNNLAINNTSWTYTTFDGSTAIFESPVTTVNLSANEPYRFKLHGWCPSGGQCDFNNAYFWARPTP